LGYGAKIDHISWSPRSHRIAFSVLAFSDDLITHQAVFTVAPDGTNLQQITSWDGAGDPDWSPNGRVLVTTDGKPEDTAEPALVDRLVLRRPNGTKLRRIPVAMAADPTWSPNSHRLVYVRVFDDQPVPTPDGNLSLWFIRPDGSDRHRVVIECSRWQHQRLGGATTVDWQPLPSG
jgi:Tol biopolymer transport system component